MWNWWRKAFGLAPLQLFISRLLAVSSVILISGIAVIAQQLDARAYSVSPVGVNIAILNYGYSSGDLNFDPSLTIEDGSAQINSFTAGYFRSLRVLGRSANVSAIVPYAWGKLQGSYLEEFRQISRSGLTDSYARFAINLYGARAMNLKEFASYRQRTNIGVSVTATAPTGQYDPARAINAGTNRWAFKPEVGISHAFRKTRLVLDAYAGAWIYTANNNYQGRTRTQRPIINTQVHLSYDIKPRLWAALDATFFKGGQSAIDGADRNDRQRNSRIGATFSVPVTPRQALKVVYSTGVFTTIGGDFEMLFLGYQYLWGGGL